MNGQTSIFDPQPALHRDDPPTSQKAATKARPSVGSETWEALRLIHRAGFRGISNREIQLALHPPSAPAWNKVATRTKWLRDHGYARLGHNGYGDPYTRTVEGTTTLINFITPAGARLLGERNES